MELCASRAYKRSRDLLHIVIDIRWEIVVPRLRSTALQKSFREAIMISITFILSHLRKSITLEIIFSRLTCTRISSLTLLVVLRRQDERRKLWWEESGRLVQDYRPFQWLGFAGVSSSVASSRGVACLFAWLLVIYSVALDSQILRRSRLRTKGLGNIASLIIIFIFLVNLVVICVGPRGEFLIHSLWKGDYGWASWIP